MNAVTGKQLIKGLYLNEIEEIVQYNITYKNAYSIALLVLILFKFMMNIVKYL